MCYCTSRVCGLVSWLTADCCNLNYQQNRLMIIMQSVYGMQAPSGVEEVLFFFGFLMRWSWNGNVLLMSAIFVDKFHLSFKSCNLGWVRFVYPFMGGRADLPFPSLVWMAIGSLIYLNMMIPFLVNMGKTMVRVNLTIESFKSCLFDLGSHRSMQS